MLNYENKSFSDRNLVSDSALKNEFNALDPSIRESLLNAIIYGDKDYIQSSMGGIQIDSDAILTQLLNTHIVTDGVTGDKLTVNEVIKELKDEGKSTASIKEALKIILKEEA